jgi:hypothetical protein
MRASTDRPEPTTSRRNGSLFVIPPSIVGMLAVGCPANGAGRPQSAMRTRAEAPGTGRYGCVRHGVDHVHPGPGYGPLDLTWAGIDSTVVSALHSISDSGLGVRTDA